MLKLNVGFNRKTGEANYGSRGANVTLEIELDSSLVGDPDRLKDRIRHLFGLAKASVDQELAMAASDVCATNRCSGHGTSGGIAHSRVRREGRRRATTGQLRALNSIAESQGLDLAESSQLLFGASDPADLSIAEASRLIDTLKSQIPGNGR